MKSKQNVRHYLFDVEMLRRRLLRPYFIELGLTVGQGQPRILYELRKCDGMSQKELSDACLIEVTTMSRTLDRLWDLLKDRIIQSVGVRGLYL